MIAATQFRHATPGHDYDRRKQAEGHSRKKRTRALKRRTNDVVDRQLLADARR